MNNFIEDLKKYFDETPREKVLEDWLKSKEFNKVGPTVDEFINNMKYQHNQNLIKTEVFAVLEWLTNKDSKLSIKYSNKEERFSDDEDWFTIEQVYEMYLKQKQ